MPELSATVGTVVFSMPLPKGAKTTPPEVVAALQDPANQNQGILPGLHIDRERNLIEVYRLSDENRRRKQFATSLSASPQPAAVNETITVTCTLPNDAEDTSVKIGLAGGTLYDCAVSNGAATWDVAFELAGTYEVIAYTPLLGQASLEVTVDA